MKKVLMVLALTLLVVVSGYSQTTNSNTNSYTIAENTLIGGALTNVALDLYGVRAQDSKLWGYGIAGFYNITPDSGGIAVGPGVGIEHIGSDWFGFSGTMQFKVATHPLKFLGGFATNIVFTPMADAGVSTSLGGAGNQNNFVAAVYGAGGAVDLINIGGGWKISAGAMVNHWNGAGKYDGIHELVGIQLSNH